MLPYFQKLVFSTTSWVLQKWSHNFHSNCQITFWTLTNGPTRFVKFDNRKKNRPNLFLQWNLCLFLLKSFCFQQTACSVLLDRNARISSTVFVKLPFRPLQIVVWGLSDSIIGEKIGQICFPTGKVAFFSEIFVFNNLLGPKDLIVLLPH